MWHLVVFKTFAYDAFLNKPKKEILELVKYI